MARKPKLVLFADEIHWLSPAYAAQKTGLTKPELWRRAVAGEIRFRTDSIGKPNWYALPDIDHLRARHLVKQQNKRPPKRHPKTDVQLEKEWAKVDSKRSSQEPIARVPESRRGNKPMLWRMLAKPKTKE